MLFIYYCTYRSEHSHISTIHTQVLSYMATRRTHRIVRYVRTGPQKHVLQARGKTWYLRPLTSAISPLSPRPHVPGRGVQLQTVVFGTEDNQIRLMIVWIVLLKE